MREIYIHDTVYMMRVVSKTACCALCADDDAVIATV